MLPRICARARKELGCEYIHDEAVLVGRPGQAVAAQERRAGALLAAETEAAVEETVDEVLEADRDLDELAADLPGHAIDEGARHQGLADGGAGVPGRPLGEEGGD